MGVWMVRARDDADDADDDDADDAADDADDAEPTTTAKMLLYVCVCVCACVGWKCMIFAMRFGGGWWTAKSLRVHTRVFLHSVMRKTVRNGLRNTERPGDIERRE